MVFNETGFSIVVTNIGFCDDSFLQNIKRFTGLKGFRAFKAYMEIKNEMGTYYNPHSNNLKGDQRLKLRNLKLRSY